MSDDHEALAQDQDAEATDMADESHDLEAGIEAAKDAAAKLESTTGIATPDPAVDPTPDD